MSSGRTLPAASAHLVGEDPVEIDPAEEKGAFAVNLEEALLRDEAIDQSLSCIVVTHCFRCCWVLVLERWK